MALNKLLLGVILVIQVVVIIAAPANDPELKATTEDKDDLNTAEFWGWGGPWGWGGGPWGGPWGGWGGWGGFWG